MRRSSQPAARPNHGVCLRVQGCIPLLGSCHPLCTGSARCLVGAVGRVQCPSGAVARTCEHAIPLTCWARAHHVRAYIAAVEATSFQAFEDTMHSWLTHTPLSSMLAGWVGLTSDRCVAAWDGGHSDAAEAAQVKAKPAKPHHMVSSIRRHEPPPSRRTQPPREKPRTRRESPPLTGSGSAAE